MTGRPQESEAAAYFFTYINQVKGDDPLAAMATQFDDAFSLFCEIGEEKSLYRYAPEKWSIRESLSHLTDTERVFTFRALWFARGFTAPLASFDQTVAVSGAKADRLPWAAHVEEFRQVRTATISLFRHLPEEAWMASGIASDKLFTVRALAFIIAGHVAHHMEVIRDKYLNAKD